MWRISIHRVFDSFGGPLSPCGSHLLRLEPFTQICSRTLCNVTATNVNNMYLLFSICSTKLSRVSLQCSHVTMTLNKCPNALKAQVSSCYNIADFVLHAFGVIPQQPKSTYISWWGLTHQNLFLIVQPTDLEHPNNAVMWQWRWTNAQMR